MNATEALAALAAITGRDARFAGQLAETIRRLGRVSPRQIELVEEMTRKAAAPAPARVEVGNLAGILALFAKAGAALKRPAVVIGNEIRISQAGERSRNPGALYVTTGGVYLGRITPAGDYVQSREAAGTDPAAVVATLREFAAEPAAVAARYGRATGNCSFCARLLTDSRSTSVGYGPICADHYGLPWGERPALSCEEVAA
jgi:hypothetical protein